MNGKEALEMLYDDCEMDSGLMIKNGHSFEDLEKAFEVLRKDEAELEELKRRETPMKPELISHTHELSAFVDYQCPNCKTIISKEARINICLKDDKVQLNYCPSCGQRLDWNIKGETK